MKCNLRIVAVAACFAVAALLPARADEDIDERILDYQSDITVAPDATLSVIETITVNAQGFEIKHGVFRDFPTLNRNGVHVWFDVSGVTLDGRPETYEVDSLSGGKRVKIGDPDTDVSHGRHVYTIAYTTDRQIHFFPKFDELYWNVNGNGWEFGIDHVEATLHLPANARILQSSFYTGLLGERGKSAVSQQVNSNTIRFATTDRLNDKAGLTVAVGFSKGAVAPPTQNDTLRYFVRDHTAMTAFLIGLAILVIYYTIAWLIAGRDPSGGTIIPLFAPPDGMSAASVRYLVNMSFDNKMYSATLVSLAAKGYLTIAQSDDKTYTLKRTARVEADCGLTPDEKEAAHPLFSDGDKIDLSRANHDAISLSRGALSLWLGQKFDEGYLIRNWKLFWPGLVMAALTSLAIIFCSDDPGGAALILLWASMSGFGTLIFGAMAYWIWKGVFTGDGGVGSIILGLILLFAVLGFGGMTLMVVCFTFDDVPPITTLLILVPWITAIIFHYLLRAPTPLAAKLLAQIKGFRIFLTTAEKDRLEKLNPPEVTPAVFEKFLPFAMALDCENQWSKKFEAQAALAGYSAGQTQAYEPSWYSGAPMGELGAAAFTASIGSTLTSAAAEAAVTVSSGGGGSSDGFSSGSSDSGSSGGGGGGGGGGGW